MSKRLTNTIVALLLSWVFFSAFFSMKGDSLTMDELAHLPAGYSYLTQRDMRLNPEHPPLIKDLAAFPLLFIKNITFPSDVKAWQEDINGQWDFGNSFLFKSGNPADTMIFWGRIPMILLLLLLGFYTFKISKELFGEKAALLALFLFSFSPTFLAHGRLVTTDVGAAFGVIFATYYFLKSLKDPSWKNILLAGLSFGIAELLKFSLILLVPLFVFLGAIYWLIKSGKLKDVFKVLVGVLTTGFLLLGIVYQYHVWNYPPERQANDTKSTLVSFKIRPVADLIVWMADKPILRPYAQYGLGLAMVYQRTTGGNTTYFLGEVSATSWREYFPIVYLIKEPLAFHVLTLIALLFVLSQIKKPSSKNTLSWLRSHFSEFAMFSFIALYWLTSIKSNLNIGIRHLLPVFPFTIILVSFLIAKFLSAPYLKFKYALFGALIIWQSFSVISSYPSFLTYFNESVGGPVNGYKYVVDSNLDWGQDLKRLAKWANKIECTDPGNCRKIDKIYLDYFGGTDTRYYLKEKYIPWEGTNNKKELPSGSYIAVSATPLQSGRGKPVHGFDRPTDYYRWLDDYQPVTIIGHSIFVYQIPEPQ